MGPQDEAGRADTLPPPFEPPPPLSSPPQPAATMASAPTTRTSKTSIRYFLTLLLLLDETWVAAGSRLPPTTSIGTTAPAFNFVKRNPVGQYDARSAEVAELVDA